MPINTSNVQIVKLKLDKDRKALLERKKVMICLLSISACCSLCALSVPFCAASYDMLRSHVASRLFIVRQDVECSILTSVNTGW